MNEQCCDINLNSTEYGEFRWSLTGCDNKRIFMCETFACNKYQFRCTNSQQCVGSKSVCDGERDCDDGSDELDCGLGKWDKCLFANSLNIFFLHFWVWHCSVYLYETFFFKKRPSLHDCIHQMHSFNSLVFPPKISFKPVQIYSVQFLNLWRPVQKVSAVCKHVCAWLYIWTQEFSNHTM